MERLRAVAVDGAMALSAQQAANQSGRGRTIVGWKLPRNQRVELLQQFPPKYREVVADHVTLATKLPARAGLPSEEHAEVIGRADDGKGVEALVVRIGGTSDRPDGSTYHITWSLEPGRRAKESNDVIRDHGFERIELPMPIRIEPARF